MGWLEWSTHIVASLAWPVAVVIILCVLRPAILRLLQQISKLSWGDKAVDFANTLTKVETANTAVIVSSDVSASVDEILEDKISSTTSDDNQNQSDREDMEERASVGSNTDGDVADAFNSRKAKRSHLSDFDLIAAISPVSAVIDAWRPVEDAMIDLYDESGLFGARPKNDPVPSMAKQLVFSGILMPTLHDNFMDMLKLRNSAMHGTSISVGDALRYKNSAEFLVGELNQAKSDLVKRKKRGGN